MQEVAEKNFIYCQNGRKKATRIGSPFFMPQIYQTLKSITNLSVGQIEFLSALDLGDVDSSYRSTGYQVINVLIT